MLQGPSVMSRQLSAPAPAASRGHGGCCLGAEDAVVSDELAVGQALEGRRLRVCRNHKFGRRRLGLGAAASLIVPEGRDGAGPLQGTVRAGRTLNSPLPANKRVYSYTGTSCLRKKTQNQLANFSMLGRDVQVGRGGHGLS